MRRVLSLAASLAVLASACGGGGGGGGAPDRVQYLTDHTGVLSVILDNREITAGGLYIIGACNTTDDPRTNVTSFGAPGQTLISPTAFCPGAPYAITAGRQGDALLLTLVVGPLPANYAFLSVPMQFPINENDVYRASTGREGEYGSIPPRNGPGEVLVLGATWAEVAGDGFMLRRSFDYPAVSFIRNPWVGVETIEPRWLDLKAGSVLTAHERIEVLPR